MSDLGQTLRLRLLPEQISLLREASTVASGQGAALFLVGGTVRDLLLGSPANDLDLSVVGDAAAVALSLARELNGEILARSQFNTFKLAMCGVRFDLAMARRESYARPGALPAVQPGSIEDDLGRRDFSINAMAISLGEDDWGVCLDPFHGSRDLHDRLLRVLHHRSFADDATRILRALRYADRLGFQLEEDTEALLTLGIRHLDAISGDRIRHELDRTFGEDRAPAILAHAQSMGVLAAIHPALRLNDAALAGLERGSFDAEAGRSLLLLGVLTFDAGPHERPGLIARLNMDGRWATVVRDTGSVRSVLDALRDPAARPSRVHSLLGGLDLAAIQAAALASDDRQVEQTLKSYLTELRHVRTILRGGDLLALGVPEGPMVGGLLEDLLAARLDGLLETREEEETFVARSLERAG